MKEQERSGRSMSTRMCRRSRGTNRTTSCGRKCSRRMQEEQLKQAKQEEHDQPEKQGDRGSRMTVGSWRSRSRGRTKRRKSS